MMASVQFVRVEIYDAGTGETVASVGSEVVARAVIATLTAETGRAYGYVIIARMSPPETAPADSVLYGLTSIDGE